MPELSPEQAYLFRITHIDNVSWILKNGLLCAKAKQLDPNFRVIGNRELISKREGRVVPISPGGTLSDYVPFYFTPYSPMLYNIKTGYGGMTPVPMPEIVILVSSLIKLEECGVPYVFTDRHAYVTPDRYFNTKNDLADVIDWPLLRSRNFKRDPDDPGKME